MLCIHRTNYLSCVVKETEKLKANYGEKTELSQFTLHDTSSSIACQECYAFKIGDLNDKMPLNLLIDFESILAGILFLIYLK